MTGAWNALSQCLPTLNANSDAWWQLTGRHLAAIVEAAGYPIEKQYEALLFHYHWTLPYMGQAPGSCSSSPNALKWKSLMALDGTPIEYSWKWNNASPKSMPNVRYVVEAIGENAGTDLDPLNQQATREILHRMAFMLPKVDNNWANHFLSTLYDHDNAKFAREAVRGGHLGTSVQLAVEFVETGPAIKTYFFPRKFGQAGIMPLEQWQASIDELQLEHRTSAGASSGSFETPARTALDNFLATSPEGKHLTPISLAVDNVAPEKSRLKWYFHTARTSFVSVRHIMTLGGSITTPKMDSLLSELHSLVKTVNGLADDFPEDKEVPAGSELQTTCNFGELSKALKGYLYYFDIAPGKAVPEIKLFVPTRYYGRDDLALGSALTQWMEVNGRGAYCAKYLTMLESLAGHRRLDEGKGLQTYVSCLFKKGELDITTYLGAEAFHKGRLPCKREQKRGTLRRDEWY
ncbi:dimethylallyl tryptophan synthase GliD1 [Dothidotthia symphoricarpi CBS 119687]|uniref:Dimethylallyl tryptophan synthase GliD1 n=1 Tax=Dothidotthia symphoricarpi CBS 119687 TaxID=1392245 RepID=A0A6A6AR08_9PLEO|nr:dimethylallyl tryptophan synthase GliD1 [Dothidotthia symphoricarpi CBS 119687]KAF2133643.1 dimethylallyl tryptophan synthase GliD1 [Dothidotthia symphoricarpi CBS 119687]